MTSGPFQLRLKDLLDFSQQPNGIYLSMQASAGSVALFIH